MWGGWWYHIDVKMSWDNSYLGLSVWSKARTVVWSLTVEAERSQATIPKFVLIVKANPELYNIG